MTITAFPNPHAAKLMNTDQRKILAFNALRKDIPITKLSDRHSVSRKFIYTQKE